MGADDRAHLQIMPPQNLQYGVHFVAGIHHNRFARRGIARIEQLQCSMPTGMIS